MKLHIEYYTLDNGMTIILAPNQCTENNKSIYVSFVAKVGFLHQKYPDNLGYAHMFEHMFISSCHPTIENGNEYIEKHTFYNNAFTSNHITSYEYECDNENLLNVLKFIVESYQNPTFRENDIIKEKNVHINEKRYHGNTIYFTNREIYEKSIYFNNKYRDEPIENIMNMTKDDFLNFYNKYYNPQNCCLIISGSFTNNFIPYLKKEFEKVKNTNNFNPLTIYDNEKKLVNTLLKRKKPLIKYHSEPYINESVHINIMIPLKDVDFIKNTKRNIIIHLLSTYLSSGFESPLMKEIRIKLSSSYSPYSTIEKIYPHYFFIINCSTTKSDAQIVFNTILSILEDLKKNIDEKRLKLLIKKYIYYELKFFTNMEKLNDFIMDTLFPYYDNYKFDYEEYIKLCDAITVKDLLDMSNEIFQKNILMINIYGDQNVEKININYIKN